MHLRWKLGVVLGGGHGTGREVCLRLARAGAGVLVADRDLAAADEVAALARTSRVAAWSLCADPADDREVELLAARARDLGGADLVVVTGVSTARAGQVASGLLAGLREVEVVEAAGLTEAAVAVAVLDRLGAAEVGTAVVVAHPSPGGAG